MNLFDRLQGVFFNPKPTMKAISEKPAWIVALIILFIALALFNHFTSPHLQKDTLQLLEGPDYQKAAEAASQLDPSLLGNFAYDAAQDMIDRFYSIEGIQSFENYLESLKSFVKSSRSFDQGDMEAALGALTEGLSLLSEGRSLADPSIQPYYTALESAFDSLQMKMRGQPDLG